MKKIKKKIDEVKKGKYVEGISSDWFLRHFSLIIIVLFFSLTYIAQRFDCLSAQKQILELQERLNTVRTDTRAERALYMSATGESAMLKKVEALGLDLHLQDRPPYTLEMPK